jgi:hypothetical protein
MSAKDEILALAFIEPLSGKQAELEVLLRSVGEFVERKQYGRDALYRDNQNPGGLVLARWWRNAEARAHAQEDPEMHAFWRDAGLLCRVVKVYEELTPA